MFAGPYKDVIGETIWDDLQPLIKQYEPYLTFLGTLNPAQMADFFALCDVVTVASINNTESFGLVQVEAFMCGTPVVATNLPGVRQPVTHDGHGRDRADRRRGRAGRGRDQGAPGSRRLHSARASEIMRTFELERTVDEYEELFAPGEASEVVRTVTDYLAETTEGHGPAPGDLARGGVRVHGAVPLVSPVLDIGCGDGHFASIAYEQLPIDVGIDVMTRDLPEAAPRRTSTAQVMFASATESAFRRCGLQHRDQQLRHRAYPGQRRRAARDQPRAAAGRRLRHDAAQRALPRVSARLDHVSQGGPARAWAQAYGRFFNRISYHYHVYPPEDWRERLDGGRI